jgi:hypothetical protein
MEVDSPIVQERNVTPSRSQYENLRVQHDMLISRHSTATERNQATFDAIRRQLEAHIESLRKSNVELTRQNCELLTERARLERTNQQPVHQESGIPIPVQSSSIQQIVTEPTIDADVPGQGADEYSLDDRFIRNWDPNTVHQGCYELFISVGNDNTGRFLGRSFVIEQGDPEGPAQIERLLEMAHQHFPRVALQGVTLFGKRVTSLDPRYLFSIFPTCNNKVFVAPVKVVWRYIESTNVSIVPSVPTKTRAKRVRDEEATVTVTKTSISEGGKIRRYTAGENREGNKRRLLGGKGPQLLLTYNEPENHGPGIAIPSFGPGPLLLEYPNSVVIESEDPFKKSRNTLPTSKPVGSTQRDSTDSEL